MISVRNCAGSPDSFPNESGAAAAHARQARPHDGRPRCRCRRCGAGSCLVRARRYPRRGIAPHHAWRVSGDRGEGDRQRLRPGQAAGGARRKYANGPGHAGGAGIGGIDPAQDRGSIGARSMALAGEHHGGLRPWRRCPELASGRDAPGAARGGARGRQARHQALQRAAARGHGSRDCRKPGCDRGGAAFRRHDSGERR